MKFISKLINFIVSLIIVVLLSTLFILSFKNFKNEPLFIDKEFSELFKAFQKDAEFFNATPIYSGLTTSFVHDIEGDILGYCIPAFNTVKISKQKWNTLSDLRKKLLLYHEWGHCTLRRDHLDSGDFNCPISIMHPYINPTASCYPSFKEWYDKELFTNPYKTDLIKKENYETTGTTATINN